MTYQEDSVFTKDFLYILLHRIFDGRTLFRYSGELIHNACVLIYILSIWFFCNDEARSLGKCLKCYFVWSLYGTFGIFSSSVKQKLMLPSEHVTQTKTSIINSIS
jgi:hypothetical protein